MQRFSLISLFTIVTLALVPIADAQRQRAEVVQGMSSGQLTTTVEELRVSNAELRARMTGIESDKAQLNGKVETLEFLLSESRDQINKMQVDDAELSSLITRLESRISQQEKTIADLSRQINDLRPEPAFMSAGADQQSYNENEAVQSTEQQVRDSDEAPVTITSTGPTRIVRRVVTDGDAAQSAEASTQLGPNGQPLPQGSLGTLSASALPGDAGPLFAEAKSRLLQFDYAGAEGAFRSFLDQFSDDPQAGEAQYWLAEVLYQQEAYAESGAAYTDMIRTYPDDPRAPEALAKLARSMRLVGDTDQACNALNILPQRYPNASGVTKNLAAGERVRSGCDS